MSRVTGTPPGDRLVGWIPGRPPSPLRAFVDADVLQAADVHVAARLAGLCHCPVPDALLGAALAVRAPRLGHVCVDLSRIAGQVAVGLAPDPERGPLDWPDPPRWIEALTASPMVHVGDDPSVTRPLRLLDGLLYLDRYWREEHAVAADLRHRASEVVAGVDVAALRAALASLCADCTEEQRIAAATAVLRRLTVIAGGPGTGKTTTIARLLALLDAQHGGLRPRLVALAAPTGKAAARMMEAVHAEAEVLLAAEPDARDRLLALRGTTIHRLLRPRPGSATRFRHDRDNRLPHELVVVDEASMASLSLVARLLEALRDDARLVLVGDPDQLASVEAGAVLGDVIGPAREGPVRRPEATRLLADALGAQPPGAVADANPPMGDGVVVLRRVHRFGGGIAALADAIRGGRPEDVLAVLGGEREDVTWIDADPADAGDAATAALRSAAASAGADLIAAAREGDARSALDALPVFRLLCPHRRGPYGAETWGHRIEEWLQPSGSLPGRWFAGRPLIVTENDYGLGLFNGDTGVIVRRETGLVAVFDRGGTTVEVSPSRLAAAAPAQALTIHKSQGSQFDAVGVVVAPADSPISTRELLYTAVTRARTHVIIVGRADAIAAAVERPVARASGLRRALWGPVS